MTYVHPKSSLLMSLRHGVQTDLRSDIHISPLPFECYGVTLIFDS